MISACSTAKVHGIGVIVDAVLNVTAESLFLTITDLDQHKLGADQTEMFSAVRVDPQNRNLEIGPVEDIEV